MVCRLLCLLLEASLSLTITSCCVINLVQLVVRGTHRGLPMAQVVTSRQRETPAGSLQQQGLENP
jgi:hypothetical protein